MCTLIIGNQVLGPGTVLLGANRDEDPDRPSDPPRLLHESPRVVGGRDRVAGGTWLAIRERRAAVAMLNRRDRAMPGAGTELGTEATATNAERASGSTRRSRGLVTLDVASVAVRPKGSGVDELGDIAIARARAVAKRGSYAPFSLVFLSPESCWVMTHEPPADSRVVQIIPGWHVLTHADLDDPGEPRTARLLAELEDWKPGTAAEAEAGLIERLRQHDAPAVCIHQGTMITVSSSMVALGPGWARYHHVEGRPCERPLADFSGLLERVEA